MTRTSNVKTNIKITRNPPALALITPDDVSLNYFYQGKELTLAGSEHSHGSETDLESNLSAALTQCRLSRSRLIMILSAQLTLFSEQQFPPGLSDAQIDDLFQLQLSNRTDTNEISTFYDYFLLKKSATSSTYGLIEARKDDVNRWMTIFKHHGHQPVAVVPQPIVLINHILKNLEPGSQSLQIVCLLSARIFIALVNQKQVEKISEYAISSDRFSGNSILGIVNRHLAGQSPKADHPTLVFDAADCGIADEAAGELQVMRGFDKERVPGENTFKWLRADDDFYQSVALA